MLPIEANLEIITKIFTYFHEGNQSVPTEDMRQWHLVAVVGETCFKLKAFEKQQVPERLSELLSQTHFITFPMRKRPSLHQREEHSYHWR